MTELQHVASKVDTHRTYSTTANYWAPLDNDDDDDEEHHKPIAINNINNISEADVQRNLRATINAWINQRVNKNKPFHKKPSTMILDSGATSHFMRADENLPNIEGCDAPQRCRNQGVTHNKLAV